MGKVKPNGSIEVDVSSKIAIFTTGSAKIYYRHVAGAVPAYYYYSSTVSNDEVVLTPGATVDKVRIDAGADSEVIYEAGTAPEITVKVPSIQSTSATVGDAIQTETVVRNTIADAGTVTVAQHRDQVLYQDASGGAVTMTTATAALLAAEFADMAIGDSIKQYVASNHATNTITITGGTGVTIVGLATVVNSGATFLLIKTAAATFDLVRVG